MAWTREQLFALESAIALGVTRVKYEDGTEKEYRSLDEMRQLRREMRQELGVGGGRNSGRRFASFDKGLR